MSNKARNKVFAAILKLNKATTWEERKKVITSNRKALLSDVALQILEELISTASREQAPAQRLLERYRNLLVHARSEGIDAAFASCQEAVLEAVLALFEASTWDQAKIVVKQYQHELTSPLVKNVFVDLLKDHPSPASQRILLHHQALLESVRVKGIDAAFAEQLPSKGASPDDPVVQVVLAFLNAPTWDEAKTVLLESPVPLPPQQVGEIFDEIMWRARSY